MSKRKKEIRNRFRTSVFERDGHKCVVCGFPGDENLDAHHITDRDDMPNGGYVKENGISLCNEDRFVYNEDFVGMMDSCHKKAEKYHITEGEEWEDGFHPSDLYEKIGSSYELAYERSLKL